MKDFLKLYISTVPSSDIVNLQLNNPFRDKDMALIKNEKSKKEKYWIWILFEIALKDSLDINIADLKFKKLNSGKIVTDGFSFSFSHSHNLLLVAISSNNVGVDIEKMKDYDEHFVKRILNEDEYSEYLLTNSKKQYFFTKWTQKEAIFKFIGTSINFIPSKIDTTDFPYLLKSICKDDFVFSVASINKIDDLKIINLNE